MLLKTKRLVENRSTDSTKFVETEPFNGFYGIRKFSVFRGFIMSGNNIAVENDPFTMGAMCPKQADNSNWSWLKINFYSPVKSVNRWCHFPANIIRSFNLVVNRSKPSGLTSSKYSKIQDNRGNIKQSVQMPRWSPVPITLVIGVGFVNLNPSPSCTWGWGQRRVGRWGSRRLLRWNRSRPGT